MLLARHLTRALDSIHVLAYFDREVLASWKDVGLKGYWMGYFASRAAAMGPVEAAVVEATFPSFDVARIRRAIPDAWSLATPGEILAARDEAVGRALAEAWADVDAAVLADVAARARTFAAGIDVVGARASLPLFAANAARSWPEDSALVIFHAATLAREYRGDRHLALLASTPLNGIAANVLAGATPAYDRDWVRESRGWDDEVWQDAVDSLVDRGWLTPDEQFTTAGRAWRSELETRTDELTSAPVVAFGEDEADALLDDLRPLAAAAIERLPDSAPQKRTAD